MTNYAVRKGKLQYQREMKSLKTQRDNDLKMFNSEKQRFRAKYSKLDYSHSNTNIGVVSDVRMYSTHNPGFCYKRNGDCKVSAQKTSTIPTIDYDGMHPLLFTDGSIDVDKILSLYLLSAHKTETLKPARKFRGIKTSMAKERSPVERLLERSKKSADDNVIRELPVYVLEVTPSSHRSYNKSRLEKMFVRDGRLASRLLVNDRILQLINSVFLALKCSNPGKLQLIIDKAKDVKELAKIMDKPHVVKFVKSLRNHLLIFSCESFHLTQPNKIQPTPLEVFTTSGTFEDLITEIRSTVLSGGCMKPGTKPLEKPSMISNCPDILSLIEDEQVIKSTIYTDKMSVDTLDCGSSIFRVKRTSNSSMFTIENTFDAEKLAVLLRKKAEAAAQRDLRRMNAHHQILATSEDYFIPKPHSSRTPPATPPDFLLRPTSKLFTSCEACKDRWRMTFPEPKASRIRKSCLPKVDDYCMKDIKTESMRRISKAIDKELEKHRELPVERKKDEDVKEKVKGSGYVRKLDVDSVRLDELDLARIRQEIKEKETLGRLSRFSCDVEGIGG